MSAPTPSPVRSITQLKGLLRAARTAQGLNQETLGARLGLSQARISALERFPERMSVDQFLVLLMALEQDILILPRRGRQVPDSTRGRSPW